jgi:hypothetical protein
VVETLELRFRLRDRRILARGHSIGWVRVPEERTEMWEAGPDVSGHLRMAVRRFDLSGHGHDMWDFLCECGAEDCKQWVTLPVSEHEERRRTGAPILAPGHELNQGRRSRRKARRLAAEAKALRGRAELQFRRAVRNLRKPPPGY